MPLTTWQWMWRSSSNQCGCHNKPDHCFMSNKSAPAVNILALAVTLFGAFSYLKTAPCVCRMTTLWTIHHIQIPTFAIRIIVMIHKISILRTLYSISRSSIFTSSSILVVKPLSGLTVCVRVVMVHSASSIQPLIKNTFHINPARQLSACIRPAPLIEQFHQRGTTSVESSVRSVSNQISGAVNK